jgi:hypothetical protein
MPTSPDGDNHTYKQQDERAGATTEDILYENGVEDGNDTALDEGTIKLNPQVMEKVPILPDLDEMELVYLVQEPSFGRWTEGVIIHMVGSGATATIAFIAGLIVGRL